MSQAVLRRTSSRVPRLVWLHSVLAASMLLAACPIAPDNYGTDAGEDAGSTADAGSTTDAGCTAGTFTATGSAANDQDGTATIAGEWEGGADDLCDSTVATDGTTYDVTLEGSNSGSGTMELAFEVGVGETGPLPAGQMIQESFSPASTLSIQDSWTCTDSNACGPYVTISSFDGQTLLGTYSVQFYSGASSSQSTTCNLSGSFDVTFP